VFPLCSSCPSWFNAPRESASFIGQHIEPIERSLSYQNVRSGFSIGFDRTFLFATGLLIPFID
jgi:hypothetical protein